jgi:hypothetical protein
MLGIFHEADGFGGSTAKAAGAVKSNAPAAIPATAIPRRMACLPIEPSNGGVGPATPPAEGKLPCLAVHPAATRQSNRQHFSCGRTWTESRERHQDAAGYTGTDPRRREQTDRTIANSAVKLTTFPTGN